MAQLTYRDIALAQMFAVFSRGVSAEFLQLLKSTTDLMMKTDQQMEEDHKRIKVERAVRHICSQIRVGPDGIAYMCLGAHELDFGNAEGVFSETPRLLLKVHPRRREGGTITPVINSPILHKRAEIKAFVEKTQEEAPDDCLIAIPNQEGEADDIRDRPIKQVSYMHAGEYVISGQLGMMGRKVAYEALKTVMKTAEGENPYKAYDDRGTVEDLNEILTIIRRAGYGNMYNTDEKYRLERVNPMSDLEGEATREDKISGFYSKPPTDNTRMSSMYIPGQALFLGSGRANEVMTESFFAVMETRKTEENPFGEIDIRPVSMTYMRKNYISTDKRESIGVPQYAQIMFAPDHPLRDFPYEFACFMMGLDQFNKGKHNERRNGLKVAQRTMRGPSDSNSFQRLFVA